MAIYWIKKESDAPKHPSLSWANRKNDKFIYWDRESQTEKELTLPKEFVVVAESWSIKWFLADKGWVWSPEIYSFTDDAFVVKDNIWWTIIEWMWKDIKDKVKALGLKLIKNLHYFDPEHPEELRTLCIKWAWLKDWMDTFKDDKRNAPANKRITFKWIWKWKTWAINYTFPQFDIAWDLTTDDKIFQASQAKILIDYKDATTVSASELEEKKVVDDDIIPF